MFPYIRPVPPTNNFTSNGSRFKNTLSREREHKKRGTRRRVGEAKKGMEQERAFKKTTTPSQLLGDDTDQKETVSVTRRLLVFILHFFFLIQTRPHPPDCAPPSCTYGAASLTRSVYTTRVSLIGDCGQNERDRSPSKKTDHRFALHTCIYIRRHSRSLELYPFGRTKESRQLFLPLPDCFGDDFSFVPAYNCSNNSFHQR